MSSQVGVGSHLSQVGVGSHLGHVGGLSPWPGGCGL